MLPKLNKIMLLHGDSSNQVNPNQVTSIERQRAANKLNVKRIIEDTKTLIDIQGNVGQLDKVKSLLIVKCYLAQYN